MFLHRYVDPEAILRTRSCDNVKKELTLTIIWWSAFGSKTKSWFSYKATIRINLSKRKVHTPRKALILITLPSTRCQHPVGKAWKITIHFCSIYLWNSHPLILKSCGKTPGDWIDDEMAVSKNKGSKFSPNKKEWEGGPGMLSNGNLIKNCRHNFHKAYKIA